MRRGSQPSKWPGWDVDRLIMLRDSYREVTGHMMPEDMDPNVAAEDLRRRFIAFVQDEEEAIEMDRRMDTLFYIIQAAGKIHRAVLRARQHSKECDNVKAQPGKHGWDEERLLMLQDSYRDITGHSMPRDIAPALTIKVGNAPTLARFRVENPRELRQCLWSIVLGR